VTSKLAALHFYQLSIPAPVAPAGSYDKAAFERGKALFNGSAKCATCHVPPLFTEPGNNLHAPDEIGVDSFQADRSPTHMYRTAHWRGCGRTKRAASITMDGSPPWVMWSTTTTTISSSTSAARRRTTWSSTQGTLSIERSVTLNYFSGVMAGLSRPCMNYASDSRGWGALRPLRVNRACRCHHGDRSAFRSLELGKCHWPLQAALSGSIIKAPGFAGGYLLSAASVSICLTYAQEQHARLESTKRVPPADAGRKPT